MQFHTFTVAPAQPRAQLRTDMHTSYIEKARLITNTLQLREAEKNHSNLISNKLDS